MGVRVSKSFKVAPGVRVRLNAKSTSVTLGGKGARYTVNSSGRRTTTVRVAGVSVQNASSLTMAGLLVLSDDFDLTMRSLGEVYASGVEVADDSFVQRYAPVKSFPFCVGGRKISLPLNRDLIGLRLAQLHLRAGQLDYAGSAVADMKDTAVRHEMERAIAEARRKET